MAKHEPQDESQPPKTLRERAEQIARTSPRDLSSMSAEEIETIVYELQVHQVELEIQNEELRRAQVELAESRDRYADLYEFAPVGYLTVDETGKILEANLTAASRLGVERGQLVRRKITSFIHRDFQDVWYQHCRAVFADDSRHVCEVKLRKAKETEFWARLESVSASRPTDSVREFRVAVMDITQQKEAADVLQHVNAELQQAVGTTTVQLQERLQEVTLLAKVVDNLAEGVLVTSDGHDWPEPPIVFANKAMCRITGYAADELIGQSPRILHGERTDLGTLQQIQSELAAGRPFAYELIKYRKDGTAYDVEVYIAPLFNAEGKRTHFVSIHRDVTEHKRIKEALAESEERFRLFMDNSPTIAWMKNDEGRYIYISKSCERRFLVQREDWYGKTDAEIWPEQIAAEFRANDAAVLNENRVIEVVERAVDPDDTPCDWRVFKFPFQDAGGARYVGGIGIDITERKRAQDLLRGREERLRSVLNTASDAIVTIDRGGIIEGANPATAALFGYEQDELIGRNVSLLMPPPYCDEHDGYIDRFLKTGEARIIGNGREVEGRRKDGTVFPIDLAISQVDHLGLFTGIIRDITERKAAQERLIESERLASLGEAMAGLTHESRNALARSQGNLRRLSRRLEGQDELLKMIEGAWRANDDIRRQFDEVRDYAAPMHLNCQSLELSEIILKVWDDLEAERESREAELIVNGANMELTCVADSFALRNVFRNLFDNALAACPDPVAIDIDFREAKIEMSPAVEISIRDNGPGLPQDVRERAFDAFFTTKTRGTGLGLAIVKRSVEAHGGMVSFGADSDHGAEVIITLPRSSS